jgi:hypothetical protein
MTSLRVRGNGRKVKLGRRSVTLLLIRVAARFLAGMHLDGQRRSDATFWARGTAGPPAWWGTGQPSRWAMFAGWQRAAVRLAVLGLAVSLWRWRAPTEWGLAIAGGLVFGCLAWRAVRAVRLWRHRRDVVFPLYAVLSQYLGTPADDPAEDYLSVPLDWDTDPACAVRLEYPPGWDPHPGLRDRIEEAVNRHLPGAWDVSWGKAHATWRRAPQPPDAVTFEDLRAEFEAGPEHLVPLGRTTRGRVVRIDIDGDAPHIAYSGGTGAGKSTFLRGGVAYLIHHGAELVIILDPKRISLSKPFRGLPNVIIVRDSADWPAAIAWVKAEMQRRYRWAEAQADEEAALKSLRRIVLVIEEGGSLADMLRSDWREIKGRNDPAEPPAITDLRHIEYQGRQGKITVVKVVQQANARDMGGSASRDNYAGKVLVRYSAAVWRMLVGTAPIPRAPKHRGRGYVVIGDEDQLVQLVNVSAEEAREFALAGDPQEPSRRPALTAAAAVQGADAGSGTGDEQPVVPAESSDAGQLTAASEPVRPLRAAPRYLTQTEVADQLGMNVAAFVKWRQRCRQAGSPLPEPEYFAGRPGWTDEQLEDMAARRERHAS